MRVHWIAAVASIVCAAAIAGCTRNFDQFTDGAVADSNTPHYEAPMTLCTESIPAGQPTRIRVANVSGVSHTACARSNGADVLLSNDSTQPMYEDAIAEQAPVALPSNQGVTFWTASGSDCRFPSYEHLPPTQDLTPGGTYTLILTDYTYGTDGWILVREADCVASGHMLVQVVNASRLTADFTFRTSLEAPVLDDVTSAAIDVSARPDRNYVSLTVSGTPDEVGTFVMAPSGSSRTFATPFTPMNGRFVAVVLPSGSSDYRVMVCGQFDVAATGSSRLPCAPFMLQQQ